MKYNLKAAIFVLSVILFLSADEAHAIKRIVSPYVTEGKLEVEQYGTIESIDDNNHESELALGVGYGFNKWFSGELEGEFKDDSSDEFDLEKIELIGKIQFWPKNTEIFDAGLKLQYEIGRESGSADEVVATFAGAKSFGKLKHTANIIFAQEVGNNRNGEDPELKAAWQSKYELRDDLYLGIEYYAKFGEFGDFKDADQQEHLIGPMVEAEIPGTELEASTALLFGLNNSSPDVSIRWKIEKEF